jgi:hypothetical protein
MTDHELQGLKRRLDAEPGDEALARDYERALLRSGRADELRRRYGERFSCDFAWRELESDSRSGRVRYCSR